MEATADQIAQFAETLQEEALPAVWSRGVTLSRGEAPILDFEKPGLELIFRIPLPDRPVHPQVTLWLADGDWHCDCGDRNDPCAHVVAAALALKNQRFKTKAAALDAPEGGAAALSGGASTAGTLRTVDYRLVTHPAGGVRLERWIGNAYALHRESLVARIAGIQSGRIAEPPIPATRADLAIDQFLSALNAASEQAIEAGSWPRLLSLLEDIPQIVLDGRPVRVSGKPLRSRLHLHEEAAQNRFVFEIETEQGGTPIVPGLAKLLTGPGEDSILLRPLEAFVFTPRDRELLQLERGYPFSQARRLATEILPEIQKRYAIEVATTRLPETLAVAPSVRITAEKRSDGALAVFATLAYLHPKNDKVIGILQEDGTMLGFDSQCIPLRDRAAEQLLARKLQNELFLRVGRVTEFRGSEAVTFTQRAQAGAWKIEGSEARRFEAAQSLHPLWEKTSDGAITLQFVDEAGRKVPTPEPVLRAWAAGERYFNLHTEQGGDRWAALPLDWLSRFGDTALQVLSARDGVKTESTPAWARLELLRLASESGEPLPVVPWTQLRESLVDPKNPLPAVDFNELGVMATLRPYQDQGARWLAWHRAAGSGALLADDMGLGKTLQTITALVPGSLVILPTSVLPAWEAQIRQFRPQLRSATYHGAARQLDEQADVVLTTYGVARLDEAKLRTRDWKLIVLDEAQAIKNPESQLAQALFRYRAHARIALTGTPVENRVDDLWSLFRFLNPGLLGSRETLSDSPQRLTELRRAIRPFILRRLKKDVAKDLPPRSEAILACELSPEERELYQGILAASRSEVRKLLDEGASPLRALEALLRLRQACCHPSLVPGAAPGLPSAKLQLLLETLASAKEGGHRSLVFSQWTKLLDLAEGPLTRAGISFLRIDGSTPASERARVVERFQADQGPDILLLSLKAAGVGLTLTAADHVVLLDPWWNPSIEDQAADRAHRIGQTQSVLIHRLVARDTVEERVLALQAQKRTLIEALLSEDGNPAISASSTAFSREDLLALLDA